MALFGYHQSAAAAACEADRPEAGWEDQRAALISDASAALPGSRNISFVGFSGLVSDSESISSNFGEAAEAYLREMVYLGSVRHPTRPELPLIGRRSLYSEMGADIGPLIATRAAGGHLVGMSLHEQEVRLMEACAKCYGISTRELFGTLVQQKVLPRDVSDILFNDTGMDPDVRTRLCEGYTKGYGIGSVRFWTGKIAREERISDWEHQGRVFEWDNSTFVPTALGDMRAIESVAGSGKFDSMWLKGTLRYRFRGDADAAVACIADTARRFLGPDAALLISSIDSRLIPGLMRLGYREMNLDFPSPPEAYLGEDVWISFCGDALPNEISGATIFRGSQIDAFHPCGSFRCLIAA